MRRLRHIAVASMLVAGVPMAGTLIGCGAQTKTVTVTTGTSDTEKTVTDVTPVQGELLGLVRDYLTALDKGDDEKVCELQYGDLADIEECATSMDLNLSKLSKPDQIEFASVKVLGNRGVVTLTNGTKFTLRIEKEWRVWGIDYPPPSGEKKGAP